MEYDGETIVILLKDGTIVMNATNETARAEKRDWLYMGDMSGIVERMTEAKAEVVGQ